jgi:feruloyl esterase
LLLAPTSLANIVFRPCPGGFAAPARPLLRVLLIAFACISPLSATPCQALLHQSFPQTQVTLAEELTTGHFAALSGLPPFCRVAATIRPTPDSDIRVEAWLPLAHWSGRALGTGNGGFAGKISYSALAAGLKSGDAVANTDMGMAVPPGKDASIFIGRPERWRDWGYRATHLMAVFEAGLIRRYYGRRASHSYFSGCSTGGEQALMEAQRFPQDYDGIVAGAPANNRTAVHISILWNYMATHRNLAAYIPLEKLKLLHTAVLAACGTQDGLISNPFSCHFDPAVLACKGSETSACLTTEQVETARRVYAGPVDPLTGNPLYPGVPRGSELDWVSFGPPPSQPSNPPYAPIFQWVFGPNWDWRTFNLHTGPLQMQQQLAKILNATDGSLKNFRDRGGKLIAYHGLADWLVVPGEALHYREAIIRENGPKTDDFYRLYLVPGMAHCGAGDGPKSLNALKPLEDWVEKGIPPATLPTSPQRPIQPFSEP